MTLDEAIKHCEEVAEELKEVDMAELDLMYAGDTECIDEHKDRCLACANDHEQLAEWLKELKQFKEQEPCKDAISREDLKEPKFIIAENDYQKGWNDALDSVYENASAEEKFCPDCGSQNLKGE